ncbi:MAG: hypothetical protein UU11_C0007G0032 [Parcubacteria group bacterium GW2011_GWF2_40_69]|nr:MAG: hypothetical protein UT25_C0001G0065 [Parcubacteria group bacterium GW2011_GWC1_39_12]KKR19589.1 MAG: hypothetical protein UT49_C0001G0065 [Parcubacteria group bacterium GW2011_GWF1_39_37]KKR35743.1 MAG: hypothetical protein UT68_C0001G0066 [Parcubacteria group bacterium GW2011_GWC2_40_10]KKR52557.1 MAG: hypothetical protein UT89_C0001G0065 [Parcubacteria group bacterium GW2011_GWE1_40_20]KKR68714.1 MAG: hypothetical protein UU11_C0007G0032 [Parcubacteria group bacterium GW2011_GWF2_40_
MISQRMAPTITQRIRQAVIRMSLGETIGDVPIYSLHKIRTVMTSNPIAISAGLKAVLVQELVSANVQYKADSGRDWNCLTSHNLVTAIEAVDAELKARIQGLNDLPKEQQAVREKLVERLTQAREQGILLIQQWFEANFVNLRYETGGHVPWAVVCRLRRNLGFWIATKVNRFGQDIEEAILDIAKEANIEADTPEEAWEAMGGKLFRPGS